MNYEKHLSKTKVDDALAILLRYVGEGRSRDIMRRTLADLRRVDTNAELLKIIEEHQLSLREVADLTMVSYDTVASWTVNKNTSRWRRMPNRNLALLKMCMKLPIKKG